jgi:hypothetical protein
MYHRARLGFIAWKLVVWCLARGRIKPLAALDGVAFRKSGPADDFPAVEF